MTLLQSRSMTRPRSSRALDERLALAGIATEVLPHRQRDRFNRTAEELMLAWGADKLSDAPESAVLVLRETIASKTHSASDVERLLPDGVCADRGGPVTFGPELDVVRTARSAPGGPVAGQRCRARALRERSRLMHQRSMATAARRLTAVMEERAMVPEEQEPDLDSDDGFFTTARRLSAVAVDSFSAALAQLAGSMDSEECEAGRSPDWQQQPDTVPGEAHRAERSCVRPRARIRTRRSKSSSSSRSESSVFRRPTSPFLSAAFAFARTYELARRCKPGRVATKTLMGRIRTPHRGGLSARPKGNRQASWRPPSVGRLLCGGSSCSRRDADSAWVHSSLASVLPPEPPPQPPRQAFGQRRSSTASKVVSKVLAAAVGAIICRGGCVSVAAAPDDEEDVREEVLAFNRARHSPGSLASGSSRCSPVARRGGFAQRAAERLRSRCRRDASVGSRGRGGISCNHEQARAPAVGFDLRAEAAFEQVLEELERSRMALEDRYSRVAASAAQEKAFPDSSLPSSRQQQPAPVDVPPPGPLLAGGIQSHRCDSADRATAAQFEDCLRLEDFPGEERHGGEDHVGGDVCGSPASSCNSTPTFAGEAQSTEPQRPRSAGCVTWFADWPQAPDTPEDLSWPISLRRTRNPPEQHQSRPQLPGVLPSPASSRVEPRRLDEAQRLLAEMFQGDSAAGRPGSRGQGSTRKARSSRRAASAPTYTASHRIGSVARQGGGCATVPSVCAAPVPHARRETIGDGRDLCDLVPTLAAEIELSPSAQEPPIALEPLNGLMPTFPPAATSSPEQRQGNAAASARAKSRANSSSVRAQPAEEEEEEEFFSSPARLSEAVSGATQTVEDESVHEEEVQTESVDVDRLLQCLISSHASEVAVPSLPVPLPLRPRRGCAGRPEEEPTCLSGKEMSVVSTSAATDVSSPSAATGDGGSPDLEAGSSFGDSAGARRGPPAKKINVDLFELERRSPKQRSSSAALTKVDAFTREADRTPCGANVTRVSPLARSRSAGSSGSSSPLATLRRLRRLNEEWESQHLR